MDATVYLIRRGAKLSIRNAWDQWVPAVAASEGEDVRRNDVTIPGWEGSIGPFPSQYNQPHVYARDIHSGAGNCVCGRPVGDSRHVQAAPGVPVPDYLRP